MKYLVLAKNKESLNRAFYAKYGVEQGVFWIPDRWSEGLNQGLDNPKATLHLPGKERIEIPMNRFLKFIEIKEIPDDGSQDEYYNEQQSIALNSINSTRVSEQAIKNLLYQKGYELKRLLFQKGKRIGPGHHEHWGEAVVEKRGKKSKVFFTGEYDRGVWRKSSVNLII